MASDEGNPNIRSPRRLSRANPATRRRTSSDNVPPVSTNDPARQLSPPRPFFIQGNPDRGSWSTADDDSQDESPVPPPINTRRHNRTSRDIYGPEPTTPNSAAPFIRREDSPQQDPGMNHGSSWNPASLYAEHDSSSGHGHSGEGGPFSPSSSVNHGVNGAERPTRSTRAPPSSYPYPFQAYPGNPDPLPPSRRSSTESINNIANTLNYGQQPQSPTAHGAPTNTLGHQQYQSVGQSSQVDLARPMAPFMATDGGGGGHSNRHSVAGSVYAGSAAAGMAMSRSQSFDGLPRSGSSPNVAFRAPFLSPASRPSSSVWSPPSYTNAGLYQGSESPGYGGSPNASMLALPKPKAPLPSTRLAGKLEKQDKPWLQKREPRARISWYLTVLMFFLGVLGAAAICFFGFRSVPVLPDSDLCLVMDEDFSNGLNSQYWTQDVELGGFGNGEFQMTTGSSTNIYTQNNELYIYPTLTSQYISGGYNAVLDGGSWDLGKDCTTDNSSACSVTADASAGVVVNPVMSARINTQGKAFIKYGRVEVTAKLPQGDWLWPAIWMLPEDSVYGPWPMSGEIDIMEARGNGIAYTAQGSNFVRSSLNYGPMDSLTRTLFGWFNQKRSTFADGFHTYMLEWTEDFMRFSTDQRTNRMLDIHTMNKKSSFWNRAGFPTTAQNGSTQVVVPDIYSEGANSAPFDQSGSFSLPTSVAKDINELILQASTSSSTSRLEVHLAGSPTASAVSPGTTARATPCRSSPRRSRLGARLGRRARARGRSECESSFPLSSLPSLCSFVVFVRRSGASALGWTMSAHDRKVMMGARASLTPALAQGFTPFTFFAF